MVDYTLLLSDGALLSTILPSFSAGVIYYDAAPVIDAAGVLHIGTEAYMRFDLITDRTEADLLYAASSRDKIIAGTATATEKAEYLAGLKGFYAASDLNRVEESTLGTSVLLQALPDFIRTVEDVFAVAPEAEFNVNYDPDDYTVTVKTDWVMADIPGAEDMSRYLGNIKKVRAAIPHKYQTLPSSMTRLSYTDANAIERELETTYGLAYNKIDEFFRKAKAISGAYVYTGEIYGGELT